jgi:hypothetical protein
MNMIIKSIASEVPSFGKSSSASASSTQAVAEAESRFRSLRTANSSTSQAATVSFSEQAQQGLRSLSEQAPSGLADYASGTTSFNRQNVLVQSGIQPLSVANQQPRESKLMLKI